MAEAEDHGAAAAQAAAFVQPLPHSASAKSVAFDLASAHLAFSEVFWTESFYAAKTEQNIASLLVPPTVKTPTCR